jgi:cytochrome P450
MYDRTTGLPPIQMFEDAVEVTTFNEIQAILKDPEFLAVTKRTRDEFLGGTLPHLDGPEHRRMRQVHSNLFRREALEFYEQHVVAPAIQRGLGDLRQRRAAGEPVRADLITLSRGMLSDMGCRLIGLGDLSDAERRARFTELVQAILGGIVNDNSTAPEPERAQQLEKARLAKGEFWQEFVLPAVEVHRDEIRGGKLPTSVADALDLLTLLLVNDAEISDELLLHNCLLYISGSQGAVVQTVAHTVGNLTDWFEQHPERSGDELDATFLLRAVNETLRVTPSQGTLPRVASRSKHVAGHDVADGQVVALNLVTANRNGAIFGSDPATVDPDRGGVPPGTHAYGLTFGAGAHACIGRRLAVPSRVDGDRDTHGIILRMLHAFYTAGVTPDPDDPPTLSQSSRDHYLRYPVIFSAW